MSCVNSDQFGSPKFINILQVWTKRDIVSSVGVSLLNKGIINFCIKSRWFCKPKHDKIHFHPTFWGNSCEARLIFSWRCHHVLLNPISISDYIFGECQQWRERERKIVCTTTIVLWESGTICLLPFSNCSILC